MSRTIKLDHITKIEGHASLILRIEKGKVKKCELMAIEGSRYFEGMLKGRNLEEAAEISSRICGICSCAHTLCAIMAIENALSVKISKQTKLLRELLSIGERIRSHTTHLYFLAIPDFLGYDSALDMAIKHKKKIQIALNLIKLGNNIVRIIGGRDIHPVSVAIGGFLKYPSKEQIKELVNELIDNKQNAISTLNFFANLKYPLFERERECFSLFNGKEYAILSGDIKSQYSKFKQKEYHDFIREYHENYSTANFVVKKGKSYMVGALSRINNNYKFLNKNVRKIIKTYKIKFPNHNPFINNYAQAIEIAHYIERALEILKNEIKEEPLTKYKIKAGHGIAAIEVPRGILWHEYKINNKGKITLANIITPTTQNLRKIQGDIKHYLIKIMHLPKPKLILEIEKLIRAYDPCFSCSTHFLDVDLEIETFK
jgi:coenzyme F420-reducing hydrogenase alpha subunit